MTTQERSLMSDPITEQVFGGEPNLSWTERGISLVLGLGLAAAGVSRGRTLS